MAIALRLFFACATISLRTDGVYRVCSVDSVARAGCGCAAFSWQHTSKRPSCAPRTAATRRRAAARTLALFPQALATTRRKQHFKMGRMHSNGKGISKSALPYKRTAPSWCKAAPAEVSDACW